MSAAETLIVEHLDTWSSAIEAKSSAGRGSGKKQEFYGIKKLRELILELAVRGLLVPQDSNDEPASELLSRIAKEKAALVKGGAINKQTVLASVEDENHPYLVPSGWSWARIGAIGRIFSGNSISARVKEEKYTQVDGYPFIATKDVGYGFEALDYENGIAIPVREKGFQVARKDSVLICAEGGSAGKKCGVTNRDICFGNKLFANELHGGILSKFVLSLYLTPTFYSSFSESMTGIIGGISKAKFEELVCPVPPLAEQRRIVDKVDELLELCNQLEQQQESNARTHDTLVQTLLDTLSSTSERGQFEKTWNQIGSNFDTLFTTENSIDELKRTILKLAVMGKLVEQDQEDESAELLIERVARSLPSNKAENPFFTEIEASITDESAYELPQGWAWLPLGRVGVWSTGCGFPMQYQGDVGKEFLFCKVSDMNLPGNEVEIRATVNTIDSDVVRKIRARPNPPGTVIFPKIGGAIATHKRRLVIKPTIIDNNCSGIQPVGLTCDQWLLILMRSLDLTKYQSGTSVPAVSQASLNPIRIGLPPLAEQQRIVAKLDELMALCDGLMAGLQRAHATQLNLADSLVKATIN